jgi:hypothetical protein|tara:strand:+ start:180 stop:473 length:294 start_codon:yes stop_codon:yes gene_type:complete
MQSKQAKARRAAILKKKFGGRYPTMSQQHKSLIPVSIDSVATEADSSKYKKKKNRPKFKIPKDNSKLLIERMMELSIKNRNRKNNPKPKKSKAKNPY